MKHILTCMGMTQTRRGSDPVCNDKDDSLYVCPLVWGSAINADASSPQGINRIKKLDLFKLNVSNLIVDTSRFYEALNIFNQKHRGRLFVILRDPIDRAISKYYYNQVATWERNYRPEIANLTMIEYANSRYCFDNWITRRLVHKMNFDQVLTEGDLRLAKEIIRQKALVLLTDSLDQSAYRMSQYFGWKLTGYQRWCIDKYSRNEPVNQNPHPTPAKGSPEWNAIRDKHLFDIELYRYAVKLYHEKQSSFMQQKFGAIYLPDAVDPSQANNAAPDEADIQ